MHRILVVDFSDYKDIIAGIFKKNGYEVQSCENAFDAISKLKAYDFDLVVSEVELPGDNSFDLYNYINQNYPYIPTIMTTEKSIDPFFKRIFEEGIGNVLCKPIKSDELLKLAEKLITKKNIFGIANYLEEIIETKKIRINSSKQIQKAINAMLDIIQGWGFKTFERMTINLLLNEMVINAVYHSHGMTKEKEERKHITLPEGDFVDLFFARTSDAFAISVNDFNGKLSKKIILQSINRVLEEASLIIESAEKGEDVSELVSETGRGIDMVRRLSANYYFIMKKNVRTEIIMIFEEHPFNDDNTTFSSLKIIEDVSDN